MGPYVTRLFQQVNVFFAELAVGMTGIVLINELRQAQRTGHSCRATANNDNVGFHHGAFYTRERLTKNNHQAYSRKGSLQRLITYTAFRKVCHIVRVLFAAHT